MSQTISSSDLKRQLGAWLDWIGRTREDLVIETYGRPVAVLLAYEEFADYLAYRQAVGAASGIVRRASTPPPAGGAGRAAKATVNGHGPLAIAHRHSPLADGD